MKKEYQKPIVEIVSFLSEETIADEIVSEDEAIVYGIGPDTSVGAGDRDF